MLRLQRIEQTLVVREHAGRGLGRKQATIDLDRTRVRHEIDLHSAMNDADIHRRGTEQRMHARSESLVILLQREDDPRHVFDRIHAEVRLAAVRRFSAHHDPPAKHAFAGDDRSHSRRFRDEGGMTGEPFAELHHAAKRKLLVHHCGEPHLARRLDAVFVQRGHGVHHRGETGLRVATAAAVQLPILHSRLERRNRHALHRDGVHVRLQDHTARRIPARQPRDDVGPIGKHLLFPNLDSTLLEEMPHPSRDLPLSGTVVVKRVHAVDAHQRAERLDDR